ncbi:MAG: cation:proton antiporter [Phocaeicola sp.]
MKLLSILSFTLPIEEPVVKFLIILIIILFAPLLLNRLKIPHILGLIIAGAIVGPNGFNLILRDSSIILSGTAGLLYIMFLAGLEIDLNEFVKNSRKSLLFGMLTFSIPMVLGIFAGVCLLQMSLLSAILLASMFASHTLIAYPIISRLGVKRNRAVTVTVGGTMITDTLALLLLAVIVGMSRGEVGLEFWVRLTISVLLFASIVWFLFPLIARAFFKYCSDELSQYIFILVMVFSGAALAELAGIEAIIGAFLAGLALNKLIPHASPLMNRIGFIGNAIFIPFFLIGVGMILDYKVFITDLRTIYTAVVMTVVATVAKYGAAYIAQKRFRYSVSERLLMFGLSNAQAAATLAAVMVGYNVIIGQNDLGEPIRLLDDSILNGTIIMIFVTCTIASFAAQRGAQQLVREGSGVDAVKDSKEGTNVLIPLRNPKHVESLLGLAHYLSPESSGHLISVAHIIGIDRNRENQVANAKLIFERATDYSSAASRTVNTCLRYDTSFSNGILNLINEYDIDELIMGLDSSKLLKESSLGRVLQNTVNHSQVTTYITRSVQPLQTIKRYVFFVPPCAEEEIGFANWVVKCSNLLRATGASALIYANEKSKKALRKFTEMEHASIELLNQYSDLLIVSRNLKADDGLIFILSRKHNASYNEKMERVPYYIANYFQEMNFVLIYPIQHQVKQSNVEDFMNPSASHAVATIENLIGKLAPTANVASASELKED